MNPLIAYIGSIGATLLAATVGSAASIQAGPFYATLTKPSWAPPGWVFGPVWSLLYVMIGVAGGMALTARGANPWLLAPMFILQLALNAGWSWMFFKWESGLGSMIVIVALWLAILGMLVWFWRVSALSGVLLLPYLGWVTFAAVLNGTLWSLNRGVL